MNRKVIAGLTLTLFLIVTLFDVVPVVLASAPAIPRSSPVLPASVELDIQTLWNFCARAAWDRAHSPSTEL